MGAVDVGFGVGCWMVGETVVVVTDTDGWGVGTKVGDAVVAVGTKVGDAVVVVGDGVGISVGTTVGARLVGAVVGAADGWWEGDHVSPTTVGRTVGANVRTVLEHTHTSSSSPVAPHCSLPLPAM